MGYVVRVAVFMSAFAAVVACGGGSSPTSGTDPGRTSTTSNNELVASTVATTSGGDSETVDYVAFGDSWPEGAHCNGCTPFPELWAEDIEELTGMEVRFMDLTGEAEPSPDESKTSASLLSTLKSNEVVGGAVSEAEVILIATGPNEGDYYFQVKEGSCGGGELDCVQSQGQTWLANFDAILTEIDTLREDQPTAIRLVSAANPYVSIPEMNEGMPDGWATAGGALAFELLASSMCEAAEKHGAICVDARPIINGPTLIEPGEEDSQETMRAIADALAATGLPELDQD
jgi:hypothetical protein